MSSRPVAVIPARFASSRLEGKVLLRETGKFLIEHVYEQVTASGLFERIVVATDDERIREACSSFGAEVVMTSPDHPTGTDRIAETARKLDLQSVVNIQGDEPEIPAEALKSVCQFLEDGAHMATVAVPMTDPDEINNPNRVKLVFDDKQNALYFSRAPIPWDRAGEGRQVWLHLGLYGYSRDTLERFTAMPVGRLEAVEKLEQLRALEAGIGIKVAALDLPPWGGIDTPEDYEQFRMRLSRER